MTPIESVAWAVVRRRLCTPLSAAAAAEVEAATPVPAAPRCSSSSRSAARALIEQVSAPTSSRPCLNVSLASRRSSPLSSRPSRSKVAVPSVCSFLPPLPLSVSVSCAPSAAESECSAASSAARSALPAPKASVACSSSKSQRNSSTRCFEVSASASPAVTITHRSLIFCSVTISRAGAPLEKANDANAICTAASPPPSRRRVLFATVGELLRDRAAAGAAAAGAAAAAAAAARSSSRSSSTAVTETVSVATSTGAAAGALPRESTPPLAAGLCSTRLTRRVSRPPLSSSGSEIEASPSSSPWLALPRESEEAIESRPPSLAGAVWSIRRTRPSAAPSAGSRSAPWSLWASAPPSTTGKAALKSRSHVLLASGVTGLDCTSASPKTPTVSRTGLPPTRAPSTSRSCAASMRMALLASVAASICCSTVSAVTSHVSLPTSLSSPSSTRSTPEWSFLLSSISSRLSTATPTSTSLPPLSSTLYTTNSSSPSSSSPSDWNATPIALHSALPSDASYCFSKSWKSVLPRIKTCDGVRVAFFSEPSMSNSINALPFFVSESSSPLMRTVILACAGTDGALPFCTVTGLANMLFLATGLGAATVSSSEESSALALVGELLLLADARPNLLVLLVDAADGSAVPGSAGLLARSSPIAFLPHLPGRFKLAQGRKFKLSAPILSAMSDQLRCEIRGSSICSCSSNEGRGLTSSLLLRTMSDQLRCEIRGSSICSCSSNEGRGLTSSLLKLP